ncbi:MAG TPA: histidinol-phosphate transaminase [Mucilaginibacter sp.]|nr:histidinol-phosphate transaminase [Mucilaginibacter sp.]
MRTDRRFWIKQMGLGIVGLGLTRIPSLAAPGISRPAANDKLPIILRSNENPYGPSPSAQKAIADHLTFSNRYHWDIAPQLIEELAGKNQVSEENILLGAGSTEILDLVSKYAASKPGNYVIADPSYAYWTSTLDHLGMTKIKVPLTAAKTIDLAAMSAAINTDTRLVYICNPNNPTGTLLGREALAGFISRVPQSTTIIVDEAYLDFTRESSLTELTGSHPNLVIAKTFSKIYGLAGARIGYAIAHQTMIRQLTELQSNTNNSVSVLSKLAALASLKDEQFVSDCYALNEKARNYTISELTKLHCTCIPSHTNFIYFSLANYPKDFFKLLEANNIQGTGIYEEQGKWTRITVGTMQEMRQFIRTIQ